MFCEFLDIERVLMWSGLDGWIVLAEFFSVS